MTKRCIRQGVFIACMLVISFSGLAQDKQNLLLAAEQFKHLQDVYRAAGAVSYVMKYTYANERTPGLVLDSLSGMVELNGNNYRCDLDSTETMSNGRYTIILFKKDKVMYLAKAQKKQQPVDMPAMLDSTLASIPGLKCSIAVANNLRVVTLQFPPNMKYKEIRFSADTATGFIQQVGYIVKTEQLLDPQVISASALEGYDEYAVVNMRLYNYGKGKPADYLVDENKFFRKEGNVYKTAGAFKDYRIFLGTPNL